MTTDSSTANGAEPKTVVVLGVAYGGVHAAAALVNGLPEGWRVVAIDRTTHANHVYVFPRFAIDPEHAAQSFVPRTAILEGKAIMRGNDHQIIPPSDNFDASKSQHEMVHGIVTDLKRNSVTVLLPDAKGNFDDVKDDGSDAPAERLREIPFEYCVYALGAGLPSPSDVWGERGEKVVNRGQKKTGMAWLAEYGERVKKANRVLVVGGGALGIQFATDIKETYPEKDVTLMHSRARLLPIYHEQVHDHVIARCKELGIKTILGERVMEWPENPDTVDGTEKVVRTDKGTEVAADMVLVCTGSKPHVELMSKLDSRTIAPNGRISVNDMQRVLLGEAPQDAAAGVAALSLSDAPANGSSDNLDHFFAIGDCADTKAIQAGHCSYAMGGIAARNIVKLINGESEEEFEHYDPGGPLIKVTLGLKHYVIGRGDGGVMGDDGVQTLQAKAMWDLYGVGSLGDEV